MRETSVSTRFRAWAKRQIPPVRNRDDRIAHQRVTIRSLRDQLAQAHTTIDDLRSAQRQASYQHRITQLRQDTARLERLDGARITAKAQLPHKLLNYQLARSHGFAIPQVLAVWPRTTDVSLSELEGSVAIKSDVGASSRSVILLRRAATGHVDITTGNHVSDVDLRRHLEQQGRTRGPFFAERFIESASGWHIPEDVKVFCFYGRVGQVLLRRVGRHGDPHSIAYRRLGADGRDINQDVTGKASDTSIAIPPHLREIIRSAQHLSRASGVSFCRVDMYSTIDGPTLGEITLAPGGTIAYRGEHDRALGRLWSDAAARFEIDLAVGRPVGRIYGPHPVPDLYQAARLDKEYFVSSNHQGGSLDCTEWCAEPEQED